MATEATTNKGMTLTQEKDGTFTLRGIPAVESGQGRESEKGNLSIGYGHWAVLGPDACTNVQTHKGFDGPIKATATIVRLKSPVATKQDRVRNAAMETLGITPAMLAKLAALK